MAIQISNTEFKRLEMLFKLKILATDKEDVYEDIVDLATSVMETPMAAISLIADDYQWPKAIKGAVGRVVPRKDSFGTLAIETPNDVFIINDTLLDERSINNPNVTQAPFVRFIVCIPLISNGEPIGALVAADTVPRGNPTDKQLLELKCLARITVAQLELREFIIDFYEKFHKIKEFSKKISISNPGDLNLLSIYEDLDSKCDMILNKIKANKEE